MLKMLKNLRGQGVTVEYAMTFTIVFAVVMGMSTYFKRLIQSQHFATRDYAGEQLDAVFNDPTLNLAGDHFSRQYEPYYQESVSERLHQGTIVEREVGATGPTSIYSKEYIDYLDSTSVKSISNQLAPGYYDD